MWNRFIGLYKSSPALLSSFFTLMRLCAKFFGPLRLMPLRTFQSNPWPQLTQKRGAQRCSTAGAANRAIVRPGGEPTDRLLRPTAHRAAVRDSNSAPPHRLPPELRLNIGAQEYRFDSSRIEPSLAFFSCLVSCPLLLATRRHGGHRGPGKRRLESIASRQRGHRANTSHSRRLIRAFLICESILAIRSHPPGNALRRRPDAYGPDVRCALSV